MTELERLRVGIGCDNHNEVFRKALLLLSVVHRENTKGFTKIAVKNEETGETKNLINLWDE